MRKVSPSGVTPLTQHIWDVEEQISAMASDLRRTGKIVALILATDGLPTDDQGYGGEDITDEVSASVPHFVWLLIPCTHNVYFTINGWAW